MNDARQYRAGHSFIKKKCFFLMVRVSEKVRKRIRQQNDGICHYCRINPATTVDHKHPRSEGGTNDKENLIGACEPCNSAKQHCPYPLFLRYIRRFGIPDRFWYGTTNRDRLRHVMSKLIDGKMSNRQHKKMKSGFKRLIPRAEMYYKLGKKA